MKKSEIIIAVILAIVVISFVYIRITGKVISDETQQDSKYLFYHSPRADINLEYSFTCYPAHEVMGVLPDNKCCEGLRQLTIYDEEQKACSKPISGIVLCSDCGNLRCEYGENNCNCPEDCNLA